MEATNNHGKVPLSSSSPASGDGDAMPLKLHFEKLSLEVPLPRAMGGELSAALQRALDRFSDVMERWLERSLTHPGLFTPPPVPLTTEAPRQPQQSAAPPPVKPIAPTRETPGRALPPVSPPALPPAWTLELPPDVAGTCGASVPAREPILPEELTPLLVEDWRPLQTAPSTQDAPAQGASAERLAETPASPAANEAVTAVAVKDFAVAQEALVQLQQGERHRLAGHKKEALACYEEALTLAPDCAQAYLGRASIYIEQRRLQEALLDCNSALREQPERAVLYVLRGLVYRKMGNLKRAFDEAEEAVRFDPRLPSAYMLRGSVRFKKGMVDDALSDVKQAIRLRPSDAKFRAELGRLQAATKRYEQAARTYAKALELAPDFHEVRLLRGTALRQAGEIVEAEIELTEYLRSHPRAAAAHYQRGLCRLAQRNYALAMTDFDKAVALNPKDKAAYEAKEKTLKQWEATASQARAKSGSAASVAMAATAADSPTVETPRSSTFPSRPVPARSRPGKSMPSPSRSWDTPRFEPSALLRPIKWVCVLVLVGLLGFGGFRVVANFIHDPNQMDAIPAASAQLSAEQLFERYKSDPDAAKVELSGKVIEVSGVVARQFDDKVPPVVVLYTADASVTVRCTLKASLSYRRQMQLARIEEQCKVTLVGTCAGPQDTTVAVNESQLTNVIRKSVRARR
jgi:tetratricopeptide (TPR) repeat protein